MHHHRTIGATLLAFALLAFSGRSTAVEVAGVPVDDTATVAGQKLVLNGAGVRTRIVFKVYVAALYLPQRRSTLKDIVAAHGAKRVAVTMLRDVSSAELGEALVAGMKKNASPEDVRRFAPQTAQIGALFARIPQLKKGGTFSVDWVPGSGTVVVVDGRPAAEPIPDEAFYDAILAIWLGDDPADADLKPAMLGAK